MSDGSKSGVNWTRRNGAMDSSVLLPAIIASPNAFARVVFPEPG